MLSIVFFLQKSKNGCKHRSHTAVTFFIPSQSQSYSSSINYLSCSIELSLPSIHEVQSQNPAFYSSSSSSPTLPSNASLQQYSKWVEDTCVRIMKYTIYTALSQYKHTLFIHSFTHSLIHSFTYSLIHSFTHSLTHSKNSHL